MRSWLWKLLRCVVPLLVLAGAITLSVRAGRPSHLPGAALDWSWLFYVERAAAGLGVVATVWLIGWRGLHGHFPIKFGNIEYDVKEAAAKSERATGAQERRLQMIEAILGVGDPPPED